MYMENVNILNQFKKPMTSTIIDYWKMSFEWDFSKEYEKTILLFDLLMLNPEEFVASNALRDNMKTHRIYDEHVDVYLDPTDYAKRTSCETFFIVEMTGQACREFELRGGDWKALNLFCQSQKHKAMRLDLTKDDFNGCLPFEELKRKLKEEEFVSAFRRSSKIKNAPKFAEIVSDSNFDLELIKDFFGDISTASDDEDILAIRAKEGWSATFGNLTGCQLQIYDKKVERKVNSNSEVPYDSWIRFEMRFGSLKANTMLSLMAKSYEDDSFEMLVSCCLYYLLDFKQYKVMSDSVLCRVPTWDLWLKFLGLKEGEKLSVNHVINYTPSIELSLRYLENISKIFLKVYAIDEGATLFQTIFHGIAEKLFDGKLDSKLLAEINNYLLFTTGEIRDHKDLLNELYVKFKDYADLEIPFDLVVKRSIDFKKYCLEHDIEDPDDYEFENQYVTTDDGDLPF